MPEYHVEFAIEVDAKNPEEAARIAWDLLSGMSPMAEVTCPNGDKVFVDLEDDEPEEVNLNHAEYDYE